MSAIIFRLDDATLDRLTGLAATYGCDVQTVITRLLERDPHDHDHRCPTCARLALSQDAAVVAHALESPLFA